MGTRGSLGFIRNGQHKVTYNHFDSYPSELGKNVIEYLENRNRDSALLNADFDAIQMVDENDKPTTVQKQLCKDAGWYDGNVATQSDEDWYCLLRKAQGLLGAYSEVGFMAEGRSFLEDSLFCEYAYIVNLDTSQLEFYVGFEKGELNGRYADVKRTEQGYGGVNLIGEFPLKTVELFDIEQAEQSNTNGVNMALPILEMED